MPENKTVLLVHHAEASVSWLSDYLETAGFRVVSVGDGASGLDVVGRESPGLILLGLPSTGQVGRCDVDSGGRDRDGCDLVRRIRRLSDAGVIVLSPWDGDATMLAALGAGADDYVPWTVNRFELLARIRAVLRRVRGTGHMVRADANVCSVAAGN